MILDEILLTLLVISEEQDEIHRLEAAMTTVRTQILEIRKSKTLSKPKSVSIPKDQIRSSENDSNVATVNVPIKGHKKLNRR